MARDVAIEVPDLTDDEEIRIIECIETATRRRVMVAAIFGGDPEKPAITPLAILLQPSDDFFKRFVPAPLPEEN